MLNLLRAVIAPSLVAMGVLVAAACGESDVLYVPKDDACLAGQTAPVQVGELIRVFREHGLKMFDDPECLISESQRQASNAPEYGHNRRRGDAYDDVKRRHGYVVCSLFAEPFTALVPVKRVKYADDLETFFVFGNVECVIYPDNDSEREQIERLRRAAADLAGQARRQ